MDVTAKAEAAEKDAKRRLKNMNDEMRIIDVMPEMTPIEIYRDREKTKRVIARSKAALAEIEERKADAARLCVEITAVAVGSAVAATTIELDATQIPQDEIGG